jgi:hypothetical protein
MAELELEISRLNVNGTTDRDITQRKSQIEIMLNDNILKIFKLKTIGRNKEEVHDFEDTIAKDSNYEEGSSAYS